MDTYDTWVDVNGSLFFLAGSYGPPSVGYLLNRMREEGDPLGEHDPAPNVEVNGERIPPEAFHGHTLHADDDVRVWRDD